MLLSNNFTKLVRESKIQHPTQKGFSTAKWEKSYRESGSQDSCDENLFRAGIWFFEKFNAIREFVISKEPPTANHSQIIRLFVGLINREAMVCSNSRIEIDFKDEPINMGYLIDQKNVSSNAGTKLNSQDVVEGVVTSSRHILSNLVRNLDLKQSGANGKEQSLSLESIGAKLNAAILYETYYDLWQECLWCDWQIIKKDQCDVVAPQITPQYLSEVIGFNRYSLITLESTTHICGLWKELPKKIKDQAQNQKEITSVYLEGATWQIKTGKTEILAEPSFQFISSVLAEELYWDGILKEALPAIGDITIREILSVQKILASLAQVFANKNCDEGVFEAEKLLEFSPVINDEVLFGAIQQCCNLSLNKIRRIFPIFVYTGNANEDIWLKPFIPVSKNEYTIVFPAMSYPNLVRSIENWMKIGGIDVSIKGKLYERFLKKEISREVEKSRILKNSKVEGRKIALNNTFEEIDCIFCFGNTIIVFEIKCSFFPTSPLEKYNYFDTLRQGAEQADRKAGFIRENLDEFFEKYRFIDSSKKAKTRVVSAVITNLHLGCGFNHMGIPIIDMPTLKNFIKGEQRFFAEGSKDGFTSMGQVKNFYDSVQNAEDVVLSFFLNPPLIAILKKLVDIETIAIPKINEEEKPVARNRVFINHPKNFN